MKTVDRVGLNIFYSEEKDWARHTTRIELLLRVHYIYSKVEIS